jgi:hypothetical protein
MPSPRLDTSRRVPPPSETRTAAAAAAAAAASSSYAGGGALLPVSSGEHRLRAATAASAAATRSLVAPACPCLIPSRQMRTSSPRCASKPAASGTLSTSRATRPSACPSAGLAAFALGSLPLNTSSFT